MSTLPREGELFDGKYRIGHVLGIGGMAAVIAARHTGLDEMVALKVLLPDCCDDPGVVERFVQEGKTAIKIRSEHVVRMLDVGVVAGRAYLVMEYLDGKDLEVLVREGGPLPSAAAVDLLLQACEAIGEAHALGIIHRDLKPANLFLTHRADGIPCVKVLDFGISKMPRGASPAPTGSYPTLPSMVMGSPQYMSPEQMGSATAADQRSDIWSLGAILYELLTGQLAFGGVTTAEVCARVLRGAPTPIVQLEQDVPADLALVVARCLERDRSRRYANVAELARALAPFGSDSARASAASIARVHDGGIRERALPLSEAGTMKPTAAEILAGAPRPRRRKGSTYLAAAFFALAGILIAVSAARHPLRLPWPTVVAAAPSPLSLPSAQAPPIVAAPSSAPPAPPAPPPLLVSPPVVKHHHAGALRPAAPLSTPAHEPIADGEDDAGPYDAP